MPCFNVFTNLILFNNSLHVCVYNAVTVIFLYLTKYSLADTRLTYTYLY